MRIRGTYHLGTLLSYQRMIKDGRATTERPHSTHTLSLKVEPIIQDYSTTQITKMWKRMAIIVKHHTKLRYLFTTASPRATASQGDLQNLDNLAPRVQIIA